MGDDRNCGVDQRQITDFDFRRGHGLVHWPSPSSSSAAISEAATSPLRRPWFLSALRSRAYASGSPTTPLPITTAFVSSLSLLSPSPFPPPSSSFYSRANALR